VIQSIFGDKDGFAVCLELHHGGGANSGFGVCPPAGRFVMGTDTTKIKVVGVPYNAEIRTPESN
jgi:hypothetical protein